MTQLLERLLSTPEIRGSNPGIGKFYLLSSVIKRFFEKIKIKKKRQRKTQFRTNRLILKIEKFVGRSDDGDCGEQRLQLPV